MGKNSLLPTTWRWSDTAQSAATRIWVRHLHRRNHTVTLAFRKLQTLDMKQHRKWRGGPDLNYRIYQPLSMSKMCWIRKKLHQTLWVKVLWAFTNYMACQRTLVHFSQILGMFQTMVSIHRASVTKAPILITWPVWLLTEDRPFYSTTQRGQEWLCKTKCSSINKSAICDKLARRAICIGKWTVSRIHGGIMHGFRATGKAIQFMEFQ